MASFIEFCCSCPRRFKLDGCTTDLQQPTGQLVQVLELKLAEAAIGKPKIHDLTAQSKTQ